MRARSRLLLAALAFACLLASGTGAARAAVEVKIGSVAPERSPWDKALLKIAREWESITGGAVRVRVYPGGIAGGELDMIRKVRLGVLQGAVLTNMGMIQIERSALVLNLPYLFDSDEELNYVFGKLRPFLEARVEESGFKVVQWTQSGWIYFFTKGPVLYPDDLKKFKISITKDDPDLEQVWERMGYRVVPQDTKDMMIALQSGMVSAIYLPAVMAASGQFFAVAPHMLAPKLSPLVGGLIISRRTWEQVPEKFRQAMLDAAEREAGSLAGEIVRLEDEAVKAMKEHGLVVHEPPPDAMAMWREAASRAVSALVGRVIPEDVYRRVLGFIREYRAGSEK